MSLLKSLWTKKKRVACAFCKTMVRVRKVCTLRMKTAEGPHEVKVCESCMDTLEKIKGKAVRELDYEEEV